MLLGARALEMLEEDVASFGPKAHAPGDRALVKGLLPALGL
jgi:hypothetical protein